MESSTVFFVGLVETNALLQSHPRQDSTIDLLLPGGQTCFVVDVVDRGVGQHVAQQIGAALSSTVTYVCVQDFRHFDIATINTAEQRSTFFRVIDPMGLLGDSRYSRTMSRDCAAETLKQFDGVTAFNVVCAINFSKKFISPEQIAELERAPFMHGEPYMASLFRDSDLPGSFRLAFGSEAPEDVPGTITFASELNLLGPSIATVDTTPEQSQPTVTSDAPQVNGDDGVHNQDHPNPSEHTSVSSQAVSSVSGSLQHKVKCHVQDCVRRYKSERGLREHLCLKHYMSDEVASAGARVAFRNTRGRRGRHGRPGRRHEGPLPSTRNSLQDPTVDSDTLQVATDIESIGQQFHTPAIDTMDLGNFDALNSGLEVITPYHLSLLQLDEDHYTLGLSGSMTATQDDELVFTEAIDNIVDKSSSS